LFKDKINNSITLVTKLLLLLCIQFLISCVTKKAIISEISVGQFKPATKINYTIPTEIKSMGVITGTAYVSVFDLTGRTITRTASFDVYPKDYFIGIKSTDYYNGVNENINYNLIAVDRNDKQINNFSAKAKLVRYEWQTVLKKDYNGRYYYASEEKEIDRGKKRGPQSIESVVKATE